MSDPDLDHVAVATTDVAATLATLVGDLGGVVVHGGDGVGFRWVQTRIGTATEGMTIETLVVWRPEDDDFLARFVDRQGGGAHHITFKVPDLPRTIERCRAAGITPVGIRLDDPEWQEAFLAPRDAHGTVVQLAQTSEPHPVAELLAHADAHGAVGTPTWWPAPPGLVGAATVLRRVVLGSTERPATVAFLRDLLGGRVTSDAAGGTELAWSGGGRIRVEDAGHAGILRFDAAGGTSRTVDLAGVPVVVA